MSKTTLILVILVATLLANHVSSQPSSPTVRYTLCRNEEFGNFTANSTYQDNLKTVVSDLVAHSSKEMFYNSSAGSGTNTVHGQYYCRFDVSSEFCSQCILQASAAALNCSSAKAAIVWFNECTLRYMNESMYGVNDGHPILRSYSKTNQTDPGDFSGMVNKTVNGLIQEAAHGGKGSKYFATDDKLVSAFNAAYFLAQCSPDLSETQCESCLKSAFNATSTCCGHWPDILSSFPPSCQLMYSTGDIFYFTPDSPPSPPATSEAPPPPDQVVTVVDQTPPSSSTTPTNAAGTAAIRSSESMKLGIITISLVLLMLVLHT